MTAKGSSLLQKVERVQHAVHQLPAVAAALNSATDDLGDSVSKLDAILRKFSLGVPTWVSFVTHQGDNSYYQEDIGYAKVNRKWGIAIRTIEGEFGRPDDDVEQWPFNDAPRLLRVNAVEKIPELLEALLEKSAEMTKAITDKAGEVDALTKAMSSLLEQPTKPNAQAQGVVAQANAARIEQPLKPPGRKQ